MTKNTKTIIWASMAVMALVIGVITYERQRPRRVVIDETTPITKTVATANEQAPTVTSNEIATSTLVTVATSTKPVLIRKRKPVPAPRLSYGDAVKKYENLRIQFAPKCLWASPNQISVKNPLTLMLDNRSDSTQIIMVGTSIYTVNSYDYAVVTINETNLPKTVPIACNGQYNVAQLFLQK
jgi:hypothetical protein